MSTLSVHDLQGFSTYSNTVRVPSGHALSVEGKLTIPTYTQSTKTNGTVVGELIFLSDTKTIELWSGSSWIVVGGGVGLSQSAPATGAIQIQDSGITTNGYYWIQPSGYSGTPEQVYVDFDGSESGITDVGGPWLRLRYGASAYSRSSPWGGQSGLTDPANQSTTAYSGNFTFEQNASWMSALLGNATEVRQTFESWGYGSVGWTYQGNNAYMEGRGFDDVNYTRWGGNGGTHTGVTGGRLSGMSHSTTSIAGPWNNPTANGTDATDANDAVWRYGRFYFRWTGGGSKQPLPIKGVYNADVDGASEQRYFPFRDAAGGWSGQGECDIWVKV